MPRGVYVHIKAAWNKGLTKYTHPGVAATAAKAGWSKGLTKETHPGIAVTATKLTGKKNPKIGDALRGVVRTNALGDKHHRWLNDDQVVVQPDEKKIVLHRRVRKLWGKPDRCENSECNRASTTYEWSRKDHNINTLNREDWQMMCRSCHFIYDKEHHNSRVSFSRRKAQ